MESAGSEAVICNLKSIKGVRPRAAASTPATWKFKSGTQHLFLTARARTYGRCFQPVKKGLDFLPHFAASRKTTPMHSDNPDKLKTLVDWSDVVFSRGPETIYEESLDVGLHVL